MGNFLNRKISTGLGMIVVFIVAVAFAAIIMHQFQQMMSLRVDIIENDYSK